MTTRQTLSPRLIERKNMMCCSACGKAFCDYSLPCLSVAFRRHIEEMHPPQQPNEQPSQTKPAA